PSVTGSYHDPRSELLFRRTIDYVSSHKNAYCLIVNRTASELRILPADVSTRNNVALLSRPVDGLQLLWNSDVVISGGGTMNREAALLGIPTFSIFTGKRPYLDQYLSDQKKLVFVESVADVEKVQLVKRKVQNKRPSADDRVCREVVDTLLQLAGHRTP
ncbi:MAG TPA: DUF354 domain-containing protein, partial [Bacteroidota bacterium]|nr:DUF354 domain-containing protein [Bacteroidota bacterium]